MVAQTLIFCVGAAKSGTSWLFDVLYHHPECYFPAVKELHYWDALEGGVGGFFRKRELKRLDWLRGRRAQETDADVLAYQDRSIADIQAWCQVFDGENAADDAYLDFLGRGRKDARVIGDFTPSYALLNEGVFAKMAGLMAKVRFIFVMREPVDRLWSHIRMDAGTDGENAAQDKLTQFLDGGERQLARRSNYRRTIKNLLAVVPREAVHFEYFERLFTAEAVEKLCVFLGIAPHSPDFAPDFAKVINPSREMALSDVQRGQVQAVLRPQYNFVENFAGALPDEWTNRMVRA